MRFLKNIFQYNIIVSFLILILLAACESSDNKSSDSGLDKPPSRLVINDTGISKYTQNFTTRLSTAPKPDPFLSQTPDSTALLQDARDGRDISDASNFDGKLGFSYTKLDENGVALGNQSMTFAEQPWSCVRDDVTGLIWEIKTKAENDLQRNSNKYTWYNSDSTLNGGDEGALGDSFLCQGTLSLCNTSSYTDAINNFDGTGLCNLTNWRLPLREELRSIVDYESSAPQAIDVNFFPNASTTDTWTSQTAFYNSQDGSEAWEIHFDNGKSEAHDKSSEDVVIRLVHSPIN